MLMERSELIERLAPLIPPPRAHQVRYHGILAPSASMRDRIVPQPMAHSPEGESAASLPGTRPSATVGSPMNPVLPPPSNGRRRPTGGEEPDTAGTSGQQRHEPGGDARDSGLRRQAGRIRWAALLQRVFEVAGQLGWPSPCESKIHRDALRCPRCGSTMRLLAAIENPDVARRILQCLELPARAPPLGKVAGQHDEPATPEDNWLFDQSAGDDEP
jgi:hypothetical protein